ncbi:hypothetical protein B7494_g8201 [Chlorociboria aeruginascens]|nr:hypothetical protein B7494_g8201 [Chlorociboria aeruginascens]
MLQLISIILSALTQTSRRCSISHNMEMMPRKAIAHPIQVVEDENMKCAFTKEKDIQNADKIDQTREEHHQSRERSKQDDMNNSFLRPQSVLDNIRKDAEKRDAIDEILEEHDQSSEELVTRT